MSREPNFARDLTELIFGYGLLMLVLWTPGLPPDSSSLRLRCWRRSRWLARYPKLDQLGLGRRGLAASWWILPVAMIFAIVSLLVAETAGHSALSVQRQLSTHRRICPVDALPAISAERLFHAATHAGSGQPQPSVNHRRAAVCYGASAEPSICSRHAGRGSDLVYTLPALPQPLRPRPGPGAAGPVLCSLHSGCAASPPQSWPGILAQDAAAKPMSRASDSLSP